MTTQHGGLDELLNEWTRKAEELDSRVGRAAALHNLSEYGRLIAERNTLETCAKELAALIHGDQPQQSSGPSGNAQPSVPSVSTDRKTATKCEPTEVVAPKRNCGEKPPEGRET